MSWTRFADSDGNRCITDIAIEGNDTEAGIFGIDLMFEDDVRLESSKLGHRSEEVELLAPVFEINGADGEEIQSVSVGIGADPDSSEPEFVRHEKLMAIAVIH